MFRPNFCRCYARALQIWQEELPTINKLFQLNGSAKNNPKIRMNQCCSGPAARQAGSNSGFLHFYCPTYRSFAELRTDLVPVCAERPPSSDHLIISSCILWLFYFVIISYGYWDGSYDCLLREVEFLSCDMCICQIKKRYLKMFPTHH